MANTLKIADVPRAEAGTPNEICVIWFPEVGTFCAVPDPLPFQARAETEPPVLRLENLVRRFGGAAALAGINLSIRRGELFSILGPSGCGKTTLLRLVAGLDQPDEGAVWLDGSNITALPAHLRDVNTVFQSYALFPHLNVQDNVAFGLRMKKVPRAEQERRVAAVLELAGIATLRTRKPQGLSGGEKQRVALARAVVNEPQVLLLDEPLGALDLQLRKQLGLDLRLLQKRLGVTCLYVTHDQDEALRLSDRLAVMSKGRIEQLGPPQEVYNRPRTRFVARFFGPCNLLEGRCREAGAGLVIETLLGQIRVKHGNLPGAQTSPAVTVAVRPEKIMLGEDQGHHPEAVVADKTYSGGATEFLLRVGGIELRAIQPNDRRTGRDWLVGEKVSVTIAPEDLVPLAE